MDIVSLLIRTFEDFDKSLYGNVCDLQAQLEGSDQSTPDRVKIRSG
jgi:hypothetical protein